VLQKLKEGVSVAFEKAVRRKPLARRDAGLMQLNGVFLRKEGVEVGGVGTGAEV